MYDEFFPPGDKVIFSINEQISSGGAESVTKKIAQSHGMLGKTSPPLPPPPPQILKHMSSAKIIPVFSNNAYYVRILVSQGKRRLVAKRQIT